MEKLNPNALAESGDSDLDGRPGVQPITEEMIREHILDTEDLPPYSARAFAAWLNEEVTGFNEAGELTNGQVISAALADWRGLT